MFKDVGIKPNMSTSYHPQSDGQTERLNRCLEHYLRSMVSHRPHRWVHWLPLVEWWYNSTYNSSIKRTPFEAFYGILPRQLCLTSDTRSAIGTVEEFQIQREAMNHLLKEAIRSAQNKYKQYADKRRQ